MNVKIRWSRVLHWAAVLIIILAAPSAYGKEYANPALLVSPAHVEKNMGKWIVIDCRDVHTTTDKKTGEALKGYSDGHIPGAISLGGDCAKILRDKEKSTVFKDIKQYENLLGSAGLTNGKTVVVYGDAPRITNTTVGFWILEYLGQKGVRFLNGGIEAWEAEGKKLATAETKLKPANYKAKVRKSRLATSGEVLKIAKGTVTDSQVVDSRTAAEYAGTDVRAKQGGHIPNCALNVSHVDSFDKATGKLKSMDDLERLYGKLDKNKRVIPYCQTGTRSTLTYLVFRVMGFKKPANYDDSWIIWGNDETFPIEK